MDSRRSPDHKVSFSSPKRSSSFEREHLLGEKKRLYAKKLANELSELLNRRKILSADDQTKLPRQEHFHSLIGKSRSMPD